MDSSPTIKLSDSVEAIPTVETSANDSTKKISALNLIQSANLEAKPYKGFKELPHGHHEIVRFRLVKNKMLEEFGEKAAKLPRVLLVELSDQVLFLPEHFAIPFHNDDAKVEELNNDGVTKYLFFGGVIGKR